MTGNEDPAYLEYLELAYTLEPKPQNENPKFFTSRLVEHFRRINNQTATLDEKYDEFRTMPVRQKLDEIKKKRQQIEAAKHMGRNDEVAYRKQELL